MFAGASGTAPANGVFPERTMSVSQIADEQAPGGPEAPPAFHLLAKPTGAVCNLDCSYWVDRERRMSVTR